MVARDDIIDARGIPLDLNIFDDRAPGQFDWASSRECDKSDFPR